MIGSKELCEHAVCALLQFLLKHFPACVSKESSSVFVGCVARIYREMNCLLELAGPTYVSGEAVSWSLELALKALAAASERLGLHE